MPLPSVQDMRKAQNYCSAALDPKPLSPNPKLLNPKPLNTLNPKPLNP